MKSLSLLALLFCWFLPGAAFAEKLVVAGDTVHTLGPQGTLKNAWVLVEDGKIVQVGQGNPPAGVKLIRARVVTPGLVDAHGTVGVSGMYNEPADQDLDETTDPNQADLRVLDSFNPAEPLLRYNLEYGVTTVQVTPGRRNPIGGQAGIFKTAGETAEQMAVRPVSAMVFTLGEQPKETYGGKQKAPQTRMATAALIRKALSDARIYEQKMKQEDASKRPGRDLKLEALGRVLAGEIPAMFTAHREDDILTAIRLAKEFNLKLVLDTATEGYLVAEQIRASGAPVIVGPPLQRLDALETNNATLENAAILAGRGIPIALQTGYEAYVPKTRVLLFEASVAAANGLGAERALRAVTSDAARLLGLADRVGSLEPGKEADIAMFDGDPFEYTSHVEAVLLGGKLAYQRR